MKERWLSFHLPVAVVTLIQFSMVAQVHAQPQKKPLLWAADAEGGAPYVYKDPDHPERNKGFEVEIAAALARELARPIQFKQYEFNALFSGLERGDFDFAMNGLEITRDRKEKCLFTRPYYVYRLQFVTRAGDARFNVFKYTADVSGMEVGTLEDTAALRYLDRMGIRRKVYTDQVGPYRDLQLGRIDGVLLDLPIAQYFAARDPALQFTGEPIEPGYYAIAVNKNNPELVSELNSALERIQKAGDLQGILERWKLWNADQEDYWQGKPPRTLAAEAGEAWTFSRYFPHLAWGAALTVFISCASMLLAIVLGLPIALARLYGPAPLRWLGLLYVEFFRGIPVLLLLYFLYFGLPSVAANLHLGLSLKLLPLHAAILGLGINYAAYESEIYRAGINSLPVGQWEAAASLGMSAPLTFRRIIFPQALRTILPPMTNDFVGLFKDTSIVSIIAVEELSKQYQMISKASLNYLETGLVTAVLYLIMSVPLGYLSRYLERLWSRGEACG
ncbi:MAG TPA: ABC transporter substrate-binding protein/permease [Gemmataceae bacterium]|nr:ABC transporter substrate-binding protein/permease [Gemmataceae bacterium]